MHIRFNPRHGSRLAGNCIMPMGVFRMKPDLSEIHVEQSIDGDWIITHGQRVTCYTGYTLLDVLKAEKERED